MNEGARAWCRVTPEGLVLTVRAQPRSSRAGVEGVVGEAVKVRLRAAPVDGKANRELLEVIADAFQLPKSRVQLLGGDTSKNKRLLLQGVMEADKLEELLRHRG